jgi:hypothetical protein
MKTIYRLITPCLICGILAACNLQTALAPVREAVTEVPKVDASSTPISVEATPVPASTEPPAQPEVKTDGALIPCSLVTKAEVEAILAEPASEPKEMSGGCSYTNAKDSMYAFTVAAAQDKETSGILQGQVMLLGFAGVKVDQDFMTKIKPLAESLDFMGFFTEVVTASKSSEAVKARLFTGGGNDLVYWAWLTAQNRRQGAFVAIRGTTMVNINLVVADTQSEESMLAASTTLSNEVFKRLPAKFSVGMPASQSASQPASQPAANPIPTQAPVEVVPTPTLVPSILPAPGLVSPEDGKVFNTYPRNTALAWAPVSGAVKYVLEIKACMDNNPSDCFTLKMNGSDTRMTTGTDYSFSFVGAQPGKWRVWAVDSNGQDGTPSDWWTFKYTK